MAWDSAGQIVSDAFVELKLGPANTDPYASNDPNLIQLCAYLKSWGRKVVASRQWTHLVKEFTITTVTGTYSYALPTDFGAMQPETGWNRTSGLPLGGGLIGEQWQQLSARLGNVSIRLPYRVWQGSLQFPSTMTVPNAQTLVLEYRTGWFASAAAGTTPTKEAPTLSTDLVFIDASLMVCALKLAWKRDSGFDTGAAQDDYDDALEGAFNADSADAGVLNTARLPIGEHFLDGNNCPLVLG